MVTEIERVCRAMVEAWYGGDAETMAGVLHQDLAKRGIVVDAGSGATVMRLSGKSNMVEGARGGGGRVPPEQWNISSTILDQQERIATVRVDSTYLTDICQVAKFGDSWQIVNVLWVPRGTPPWF